MKRKTDLPELLCPAGSFDALVAAISVGADAIYIGGKSFGARAFAKNFDTEEIKRATELCHLHGVKLYVTLNTLVYDKEIAELSDFAAELYKIGIDAVISADLGVISEIKRRVPELPIHASTQMSVHNTEGANTAVSLGCERVVLARELSEEDIRRVTEESDAEIEVFLHGALCVSHSGQCLMSSLVGGRSGNRGECAQPCRLPYGSSYPLSLKDLSLANHIKSLIDSGVASLKIEGRMKSPDYVYRTAKIYRTLLDSSRNATEKEQRELKSIFSRSGFTDGYFIKRIDFGMTGVRSESDKEESRANGAEIPPPRKIKATAEVKMILGEPAELKFSTANKSVTVYGKVPVVAESSPLTVDGVKARLTKMGNTPFSLDADDIKLNLGENVNLAPSEINALRRAAAEVILKTEKDGTVGEKFSFCALPIKQKPLRTAYFYNPSVLSEIKRRTPEILGIFDKIFIPLQRLSEYGDNDVGVAIPPIVFDSERDEVKKMLSDAKNRGIKDALLSNISHKSFADEFGFSVFGDFRLNVTSSLSAREYNKLGIERLILSPELTLPMARDIGGSIIVYGRIPLMLTERCFIKENFGCERCKSAAFTDRTKAKFPIIREYQHRNVILNSTPTYMGDKADELKSASLTSHHFIFTVESAKEAIEVINAYKNKRALPYPIRRMGKR